MHELSIAKELLSIVMKYAKENSLKKVDKVVIKVGVASGVEPGFLKDSFSNILAGTIVEGASVELFPEQIKVRCKSCGETFSWEHHSCPVCKKQTIEVLSGRQVYVDSIQGY